MEFFNALKDIAKTIKLCLKGKYSKLNSNQELYATFLSLTGIGMNVGLALTITGAANLILGAPIVGAIVLSLGLSLHISSCYNFQQLTNSQIA